MCYAIPGKVIEVNNGIATIEYFGERKKAKNDFYELSPGDYIYAQAGLVIQKIAADEAQSILETWREFFFKLKETDLRLTREPKTLHQSANFARQRQLGNSCCIHGIIEFSNYCNENCLYCGLRKDNSRLKRYRMSLDEIVNTCDYAVGKLGFKSLVLQSGEDQWYDEDKLLGLVKKIRQRNALLLALSIGERDIGLYEKLYQAGARAVLLRFETGNPALYQKYRPGHILPRRIDLIRQLREMGYLIMTGFLLGLPGQTEEDILNALELTSSLGAEMFSFGPFIAHPQTPLSKEPSPHLEKVLDTIARARLLYPESKILVTTALETLDKENGAKKGLLSGANSLMLNLTPEKYRRLYELYPHRAGAETEITERIKTVIDLLQSLGRAPTDLGI